MFQLPLYLCLPVCGDADGSLWGTTQDVKEVGKENYRHAESTIVLLLSFLSKLRGYNVSLKSVQ